MPMYRVVYEIDVEAHSPEQAAMEAFACITDPAAMSPIFDILQWGADSEPPKFTCDTPGVVSM